MFFVQTSYEYYTDVHKQNDPNYILNNEMRLDIKNMQTKQPKKKLINSMGRLLLPK